jgi:hypothetical protein
MARPATATSRADLTRRFQVSGRACAASIEAAFAATGADMCSLASRWPESGECLRTVMVS